MKVVVLVVLSLFIEYSSSYTLQSADRNMWLNSHNCIRSAYNVNLLVWDYGLENDSAAYAALCLGMVHSTPPASNPYGENLATYMVSPQPYSFPYQPMSYHVINQWYAESQQYNCPSNLCITTGGKSCGHFTQEIWADTTSVGCGIAPCQQVISGTNWNVQMAVCRYRGPGNINGNSPLSTNSKTTTLCPPTPVILPPINPPPQSSTTSGSTTSGSTTSGSMTTTGSTTTGSTSNSSTTSGSTTSGSMTTTGSSVTTGSTAGGCSGSSSGVWWSGCIANYYPDGKTQVLTACAWAPWVSGGNTWCCPNPNNQYDYSWPVYNLGSANCPNGCAQSLVSDTRAKVASELPTTAWIGIGVGIAVVLIVIIVVIIIVKKKNDSEHV